MFVGNLLTTSNIEGRRSARVYSWWLEGQRADWSLRAGALMADEEFTGTQTGANFLNSAFGWPAFISANTVSTGPAFYVPAIGLRVRRELGDGHYVQFGVYDGDTFDGSSARDEARHHGLRYRLSRGEGQFAIAEIGGEIAPATAQMKIGAWLHTADFEDAWADETGRSYTLTGNAPRLHRNNFGGFAVLEKDLAGKPGEPGAVSAHLRAGLAPSDRNAVHWSADAGLAWRGPIASRPEDTAALGMAWLQHGDDFARRERDANPSDPARDYEAVVEATYSAVLSKTFSIHPSVQFIHHPGGSAANRDALIGLLRVEAHF